MYHVRPDALFSFPRRSPRHWLIIMIMYPLLSVVPQTLIYRILFVRRYSDLFRTKTATLIIGATVFSLAHAMFKNEVVLIMTFLGGILFLKNYQKSQSLWLNILEHSLYGNLLFTLGYGHYFFR
jgi:membrane protease YdiL (CAAX protease family)